jgi:hypothetical protein
LAKSSRTAAGQLRDLRGKWACRHKGSHNGRVGQVEIDQDQLLEKLDVGKEGVAHFGQSVI